MVLLSNWQLGDVGFPGLEERGMCGRNIREKTVNDKIMLRIGGSKSFMTVPTCCLDLKRFAMVGI